MVDQTDDFAARAKRVQARARVAAPMPSRALGRAEDFDERAFIWTVIRPQLALLFGVVALIAGRAVAMNYLGVEPSTDVLGLGEAMVVLLLLAGGGLIFGVSNLICHGALALGAAFGFLAEGFYIPVIPEFMKAVYDPAYVELVLLKAL